MSDNRGFLDYKTNDSESELSKPAIQIHNMLLESARFVRNMATALCRNLSVILEFGKLKLWHMIYALHNPTLGTTLAPSRF